MYKILILQSIKSYAKNIRLGNALEWIRVWNCPILDSPIDEYVRLFLHIVFFHRDTNLQKHWNEVGKNIYHQLKELNKEKVFDWVQGYVVASHNLPTSTACGIKFWSPTCCYHPPSALSQTACSPAAVSF